jgi:hypothetical protein
MSECERKHKEKGKSYDRKTVPGFQGKIKKIRKKMDPIINNKEKIISIDMCGKTKARYCRVYECLQWGGNGNDCKTTKQ